MASIWKQNREVTNDVNRNNFDLSFQNHSTFKFGYLYPVFCRRVYPTDSFRIRSAFDLKLMPLAFPLQSRIRAHMHFFYVRNKNLWKGWEDFITGQKSPSVHPHPYIRPVDEKVVKGSLHDYLNVATSIFKDTEVVTPSIDTRVGLDPTSYQLFYSVSGFISSQRDYSDAFSSIGSATTPCLPLPNLHFGKYSSKVIKFNENAADAIKTIVSTDLASVLYFVVYMNNKFAFSSSVSGNSTIASLFNDEFDELTLPTNVYNTIVSVSGVANAKMIITFSLPSDYSAVLYEEPLTYKYQADYPSGVVPLKDTGFSYYSEHQPLNALPYRAYQSIYYGYYANDVLQPLVIDGEKEYNKFVVNDGDGLDTFDYQLYKRNYELDFLTSAMPSPQAGPAPLVGISALGGVTITDANGVSTGQADIDGAGNITKIVVTSPLASVEHARTMMNIASLGFNINDLRNANALQRMAEQTLRSGFRYVNWVKGQFGRSPEYRELDMPEFIGGYSRDVNISTIVSSADTASSGGLNLGSFGANGRVVGGSEHDISHYCDDYGWIIGIMSITPTPAYSQLLPKHMLAPTSPLDYANPYLNQIGMQPITYREVCPLSAFADSLEDPEKSIDDVFGYQRPNYDEVGSVDEIHGEFRGTLKDYLINRQFDGRPELGSDFLQVSPSEINDIFINQNPDEDVFIGNIAIQVDSKRPFPRVHIPGLRG